MGPANRRSSVRLSVAEDDSKAASLYQRHEFHYMGELGDLMTDGIHREQVMEKVFELPL